MMNKNKMNNCTLVLSVITLLIVILIPVFPNIIYSFIPLLFITIGLIGWDPNFNKITLIILFFIQSVALLMEVPVEMTIGDIFRYMFSIFILLVSIFFMIYIYVHGSPFRKKSKRVKSTQPESSSISEDEITCEQDKDEPVLIIDNNKFSGFELPENLQVSMQVYFEIVDTMEIEEVYRHFTWFSAIGSSILLDIIESPSPNIIIKDEGYNRVLSKLNDEIATYYKYLDDELSDIIDTI